MKRLLIFLLQLSLGTSILVLTLFSSSAFPWGTATHAFIDHNLGKRYGLVNINEIYGGISMDIFNALYWDQGPARGVHSEFMKVWTEAKRQTEKALAFGFISHNELWGADFTAHCQSLTSGKDEGYVISKARLLGELLAQEPAYQALNLPNEITLEFAHYSVEGGIDLLIRRKDPFVGRKIIFAAKERSSDFPLLLVRAYAQDFAAYFGSYPEAVMSIFHAEEKFRNSIILYGLALSQTENLALDLIAQYMAKQAGEFLTAYGIALPEGADLKAVMKFALEKSIAICAEDFDQEISATISFVDQQLEAHGISYRHRL